MLTYLTMTLPEALPDQSPFRRAVLNRDIDNRYLRRGRTGRVLPNLAQKRIDGQINVPEYEFFLDKNPDMSFLVYAVEIDWL
jgi:chemotaxis methyl-accepting protein methylase